MANNPKRQSAGAVDFIALDQGGDTPRTIPFVRGKNYPVPVKLFARESKSSPSRLKVAFAAPAKAVGLPVSTDTEMEGNVPIVALAEFRLEMN